VGTGTVECLRLRGDTFVGMLPTPINFSLPAPIQRISEKDDMFAGNADHYFDVGRSAMWNVIAALNVARCGVPRRILDFASGYGRVLRYLRAKFPEAETVACDVDADRVEFCVQEFGATGIVSNPEPDAVPLDGTFDLIWCGSLMTHLDSHRWMQFLRMFQEHLSPGGIMLFTTHGRRCAGWLESGRANYGLPSVEIPGLLAEYHTVGFGYRNYESFSDYGVSLSAPSWVAKRVTDCRQVRLGYFLEFGWDEHQDVIGCIKLPPSAT
jgi:SAM-dependent methyltransferase